MGGLVLLLLYVLSLLVIHPPTHTPSAFMEKNGNASWTPRACRRETKKETNPPTHPPTHPPTPPPTPPTHPSVFMEEWERKLDAKRAVESEKKATVVGKAQAELSKFAEEREAHREKKQSSNRKEEQVGRWVGG